MKNMEIIIKQLHFMSGLAKSSRVSIEKKRKKDTR